MSTNFKHINELPNIEQPTQKMNKEFTKLPNKKIYLYRALFLCLGIYTILLILSLYESELNTTLKVMGVVSIWTLVVYLIPLIIIYFNYYKTNINSNFKIRENFFLYYKNGNLEEFGINEIEKVVFNLSYPLFEKRIRLFFWDEYFYARIKLKNGKNIFITCLLNDNLEKFIPTDLIERKKRIFPLIKREEKNYLERNNLGNKKRLEKLNLAFKEKTISELTEVINNKSKYQKEAIEIANKILKEKNVG